MSVCGATPRRTSVNYSLSAICCFDLSWTSEISIQRLHLSTFHKIKSFLWEHDSCQSFPLSVQTLSTGGRSSVYIILQNIFLNVICCNASAAVDAPDSATLPLFLLRESNDFQHSSLNRIYCSKFVIRSVSGVPLPPHQSFTTAWYQQVSWWASQSNS